MLDATKLKNGTTFAIDGVPYKVEKYTHTKIARGGATIRLVLRNLVSGEQKERVVKSTEKFEEIKTQKKKMHYLYSDNVNAFFLNPKTFEQTDVLKEKVKTELKFIKEGSEVNLLFWEDQLLSIEVPPKVILKVVEAAPGVKGDSAQGANKTAKLENGLEIKVPLFIKKGDEIRIDTRDSSYVERV